MRFIVRLILIFLVLLVPSASSKNVHPLYEKLDLFSDVLEKINEEYVTDVNQSKVIDAAINGMLQSLDPYSAYMNPESYRNMNIETKGEFGGLGIEITMESGFIKIITPIEGSPADEVGVKPGDYIIKINETQVKGLTLQEAVNLMRGKVKTSIDITIRRLDEDNDLKFTIIRENIKVREISSSVVENVGYIRLRAFNQQSSKQLRKKIKDLSKKI